MLALGLGPVIIMGVCLGETPSGVGPAHPAPPSPCTHSDHTPPRGGEENKLESISRNQGVHVGRWVTLHTLPDP